MEEYWTETLCGILELDYSVPYDLALAIQVLAEVAEQNARSK